MPTPTHLSRQLILHKSCSLRFSLALKTNLSPLQLLSQCNPFCANEKTPECRHWIKYWIIIEHLKKANASCVRNDRASQPVPRRKSPYFYIKKKQQASPLLVYMLWLSSSYHYDLRRCCCGASNVFLEQRAVRAFGQKDWSQAAWRGSLFRARAINSHQIFTFPRLHNTAANHPHSALSY